MSIKADKWIKQQCIRPSHIIFTDTPDARGCRYKLAWAGITHSLEELEGYVARYVAAHATDEAIRSAGWQPMIDNFEAGQVRHRLVKDIGMEDGERREEKIVSYGTSSYGYDVRCANEFKVFTNIHSAIVDPKNFDPKSFVDIRGDVCIIPPNSFALARTVEYFRIPRDVLTICLGKSTYARCGIIVNVTPLEPEWEGHVTLEFSNTTNLPAKIYANEGVAQMLFLQSDEACETSYKDRGGKYQGQTGVVVPRI